MKQLSISPVAILFLLLFGAQQAIAQLNVKITVNNGASTTTCTDIFDAPDPQWAIKIDNQNWVVYPELWGCYNSFPKVQFDATYGCYSDVPAAIQVCFRAFENDAFVLSLCTPVYSCSEEICIDVPVPQSGSQDFTIALPPNLSSGGSANLTIASSGTVSGQNDAFCEAMDFGVLPLGVKAGDAGISQFNNYCGTALNEPDPGTFGNWWVNNVGVWFQFTTPDDPGSYFIVRANSDPSNLGDPVNLQVALFSTSDNTCNGVPFFLAQNHNPDNWDEEVRLSCPLPNTTYFILVDAVSDSYDQLYGWFGIEVEHSASRVAPDLRCEAIDLGAVPPGGSVSTNGTYNNVCSSNIEAAPAAAFGVQKSVWFSFQAPPSKHVLLEAVSDKVGDPIGIQMAVYQSSNGACDGAFKEVYSQDTPGVLDESFELHCLQGGETYYVMIDGALDDLNTGDFSLSISDAGDETPITVFTPVLCAGETFSVAGSVYSQSGVYSDTIALSGGCDSIVNTTLTVLDSIEISFQIIEQGVGEGNTNGQALAVAAGGAGNYTFSWSNGQTTALAVNLVGGDIFCVTIEDSNGCTADACFEMPYYIHFVPTVQFDSLDCYGDDDGHISFTAKGGVPPYQYSWSNNANGQSGAGLIPADGETITLNGLVAGIYHFNIADILFDTAFTVEILEPAELSMTAIASDASCFGECDGSLLATTGGGVAPYQYAWSNGSSDASPSGLCANVYQVTLSDSKGCAKVFPFSVGEPAQFIATAGEVQPVSCFEGSDGEVLVSTNGNPIAYLWSTGGDAATETGLPGGAYTVTVTNADGCTTTAAVEVATPSAPVGLSLSLSKGIVCNGGTDGALQANATGPGNSFSYQWSNGVHGASANNLGAGYYSVTVENEKGCQAEADYTLTQPEAIQVDFFANSISCTDLPDAGIITVTQVSGGEGPYTFSSNGFNFGSNEEISGYTAGSQHFYIKDQLGCVREFSAFIEGPKELILDLEDDKVIDLGESVVLHPLINQADGISFDWSPAELLSCTDCFAPVATPLKSGLFTLVVTDEFGCTATADIYIDVVKKYKVFVPNAFSPNGDGINDLFIPFGGNDVKIIRNFRVFDRQGGMVFSAENFLPEDYDHAWDGRFNGKIMQAGVFAWLAEVEFIDDDIRIFRGGVTLVR